MQFRMRWLPIGFEYLRLFASGRTMSRTANEEEEEKKHGLMNLEFLVLSSGGGGSQEQKLLLNATGDAARIGQMTRRKVCTLT